MKNYEEKNIFFTGRSNRIDLEELEKYLIQKGAVFTDNLEDANIVIKGKYTPLTLEDKIYDLSKTKFEVIDIDTLEKEFSLNLDINSLLLAIKISKNQDRLLKLLSNEFFTNEVFIKLLKLYDFKNEDIYDSDENRDVCTKIVERFCSLVETNHNIQYSPIGVYYTALETNEAKLLEIIYNMPNYSISEKNAQEDQPLSLKEVVALNPNSSKTMHLQIIKNNKKNELVFLALNDSISSMVQKKLYEKNIKEVNLSLIKAGNFDEELMYEFLKDEFLKKELLKVVKLNSDLFKNIYKDLDEISIIYLSSNKTLDSEMIDEIFLKNIDNANINLLKNSNCKSPKIDEFLEKKDKIYNIAIAHNESLTIEQYQVLYELNDYDVNISLASNTSSPQDILQNLSLLEDKFINETLCANTNTPINVLLQYQYDGGLKPIISNNDTFRQFTRKMIGM